MTFRKKLLGVMLLVVPVLLAVLIARSPHMVLQVPKVGFVLYAMLTGLIPG